MPVIIMIVVYSIKEACDELARRLGREKPYRPQRLYQIIHSYRPELKKAGKHFLLTEADLDYLAKCIKKPGRPPKTIGKQQ